MKQVCKANFQDVFEAFDGVWHQGLEYKLKTDLLKKLYLILKSYLAERHFGMRESTPVPKNESRYPTRRVLGLALSFIQAVMMSQKLLFLLTTMLPGDTVEEATWKLQDTVNNVRTRENCVSSLTK